MPALDKYHNAVVAALQKDGWTVTQPLTVDAETRTLYIDIGADRFLGAERGTQKIAVDVKTFERMSPIADLKEAIGSFGIYDAVLKRLDPARQFYVAVPVVAFEGILQEWIGQVVIADLLQRILVYDAVKEEITRWQPEP